MTTRALCSGPPIERPAEHGEVAHAASARPDTSCTLPCNAVITLSHPVRGTGVQRHTPECLSGG